MGNLAGARPHIPLPRGWGRLVAALAVASLVAFDSAQAEEPPFALALGTVVEQRASPMETHAYLLQAPADSFLHLLVEQRGCDVVLTLSGPRGVQIAEVDSPDDAWGPERLVTRIDTEGSYQLEVRAKTGGSYRLEASIPAPNDAHQRRRLAAERFATTAAELQLEGNNTSRREAVQQYLKALDLWRFEGEELEQARTLHHLGAVYKDLEESELALKTLHEALPLWRVATAAFHGEANSLSLIGYLHWSRGEHPQAELFYRQALELRKHLGEGCGQAQSLNNLGTLHVVLGKAESALEFYQPALELCGAHLDPALNVALLAGLGGVHRRLGDLLEALDKTARTLPILRTLGDLHTEGLMLTSMAVYHRELGALQRAFEHYRLALPIFRQLGDLRAEARVLSGLGQVYLQLGEPGQALVVLEQALKLRRAVGDRRGEAVTLHSLVWAITKAAVHSFELPARREIEDAARRLHHLWSTLDPQRQREDMEAGEALRRLILTPAEGLIARASRLVIVADGALHYTSPLLLSQPPQEKPGRGAPPCSPVTNLSVCLQLRCWLTCVTVAPQAPEWPPLGWR